MPFNDLLNDRVSVIRANGEQFSDISASVQKNKIFIQRSDILIEAGDIVERKMSNGGMEHYEVLDPGFREGLGSIPAGYQMSVKQSTSNSPTPNKPQHKQENMNPKIFIVHGHDELAKITVARFIEQIGLNPIILHEQASSSRTIIEKIESYGDVGFAIVLYTPCDVGAKIGEEPNPRARQNVVFEHGYFIGRLGRSKVAALVKGKLETPNDISGVVYIDLDERGAWKMDVAKELKEAGYSVDLSRAF
ncbi:TIR domain-containing protein [Shewanella putrefaciens]|uniref:TIR domain-containing protein n=1 Tax=Shewanella putrefaciens TaxID=24 RepID=UPI0035678C5D